MGSRGRSIRLRIYFLVAIPLITMLGLFGYVAYTSITNYQNLDRAPSLIRATSEPLTRFVTLLQAERRAAVTYLSHPDAASLAAYRTAVAATGTGERALAGTISSAATKGSTTPAETSAINAMVSDVTGLTTVQSETVTKKISALDAFRAYTKVIADQDAVFQAETGSMTETVASTQGFGLISAVNAREDVSEQDALLAGALAAGSLTGPERAAFSDAAGRQTDDTLLFQSLFTAPELTTYNAVMNAEAPLPLQKNLTRVQQGVESGLSLTALESEGLLPGSWQRLTKTWQHANYDAASDAANDALLVDQSLADNARNRVWETAAVGAAGLILTLIVTIGLGRSVNRRLTLLRRSALALANEQLPAVVARLRRGEPVDVEAQAPPVLGGSDEIGQVGQAIDAVRQTAISSAVDEARVRQGVNDMFRNLARRNQSLLQRQLTVLDDMERRATDPDVLEDLFKMDHLTTRMRRHAEGLIILSGAAPGRTWSAPVKLIDVMRGAVAEVEDYARVSVSSHSRAALSGSAVTDVIHLLAELIENSTTLSPPFTQVRVGGESVAHGYAIEIEDRGLGMSPQRLAELNERLASPPDLNPANTEQLGLFVVGQLARRHGISVTLRPSPYGGATAVVLIPRTLIVEDGPAAITTGDSGGLAFTGARTEPGGFAATGFGAGSAGSAGPAGPAVSASSVGMVRLPATPAAGNDLRGLNGWSKSQGWSGSERPPAGDGRDGQPAQDRPAQDRPADTAAYGGSPVGPRRTARPATGEVPVVTGVPVGRPAESPGTPFDVFTPLRREPEGTRPPDPAEHPYPRSYSDFGVQAPDVPSASPSDLASSNLGDTDSGGRGPGDGGEQSEDRAGLPRRVRQASLAPELRASAAAASGGGTGVPRASAESLTVMRNTLSAMQRGWQQGRSQSQGDTEGNVNGD